MSMHRVQVQDADESRALNQRASRSPKTTRVLSVGSIDRGSMVHDASLEGPEFRLSIATDYWGLRTILEPEDLQVAILHDTLDSFELDDACRLIRQRWPHARILVIRTSEDVLEDALYDDRVIPPVVRKILIATIKQLTATWHEGRPGNERS
jgi:hypothetical protein